MRSTWTIGKLFDIPIKLHVSLLAAPLAAYLILGELELWAQVVLVCVFPVTVLVHELAHALTARRFKVFSTEIVITLLGGRTSLVAFERSRKGSIATSLAGPAASLLQAALFYLLGIALTTAPQAVRDLVDWLVLINLVPGIISLLPGLPCDGGRALQTHLRPKLGGRRATHLLVWFGRILALAAIAIGVTRDRYGLVYVAVALFCLYGAEKEWRRFKRRRRAAKPDTDA